MRHATEETAERISPGFDLVAVRGEPESCKPKRISRPSARARVLGRDRACRLPATPARPCVTRPQQSPGPSVRRRRRRPLSLPPVIAYVPAGLCSQLPATDHETCAAYRSTPSAVRAATPVRFRLVRTRTECFA